MADEVGVRQPGPDGDGDGCDEVSEGCGMAVVDCAGVGDWMALTDGVAAAAWVGGGELPAAMGLGGSEAVAELLRTAAEQEYSAQR